jgi:hypothetical protein
VTRSLSRRSLALVVIGVEAAAVFARLIDVPERLGWALRVVLPTIGVCLLPGAAVVLASLPRRTWALTELLIVAFGTSAALVQLATIAALIGHFNAPTMLSVLLAGTIALAIVGAVGHSRADAVKVTGAELAWWAGVMVLGGFLYMQGSPYASGEDYLHLGVIRRLAWAPHPAVDNIYFAPGIIYTYPFPAIHYLVALISRLGDVDPIFVYHKLRFFWGPVALASLVVVARRVFGSMAVGLACGFTALAFTAAGTFATVPSLTWGQLVPYSHASDVAMGVLLPATLAFFMIFLEAEERSEARFMFIGAASLVLTLSIVHIREVVQLLVYLGAYVLYLLWARSERKLLGRTAMLLVATLVIAGAFTAWQETVVTHVGSVVSAERADLVRTVRSSSALELLQPPLPLFSSFVGYYWTMFWGWNPFLLVAAAPVLLAFRRKPLVWLVAASLVCYLLIIRFPLFGAPYIYLTYFEILFTPVRNVIFFLQLIAGAALFLLTGAFGGKGVARSALLAALVCVALAAVWHLPRTFLDQHQDVLLVPVIASLIWALVLGRRPVPDPALRGEATGRGTRGMRPRLIGVAAAIAAVGLIAAWHLTSRPAPIIHVRWADDVGSSERVLQEARFKLVKERRMEGTSWSYTLLDSSRDNVRALVESPAVGDTHEINRGTFTVNEQAPRGSEVEWAGSGLPVLGSPIGFDVVLILLIALAALSFASTGVIGLASIAEAAADTALAHPRPGLFCGVVVALGVLTFTPSLSPLVVRAPMGRPVDTVRAISCGTRPPRRAPYSPAGVDVVVSDLRSCPPTPELMAWVRDNVPVDAVFAVDTWNEHPPSVFFPQQYVGWSGLDSNFLNPEELFGPYLRFYRRALAVHAAQPFFNDKETDAERGQFVDTLGITHVLVDPAFHDLVVSALEGHAMFEKEYDAGGWAVFGVHSSP